jgi:hypothetical protein
MMSTNIIGGINYALVKRHYDADDYTSLRLAGVTYLNGIPFTATQTYYVVGLFAYLADNNVVDVNKGWTEFTHGQPAAPAYMLPFLAALGITTWPTSLPSFEAKDILFYATEDCWVRFEGSSRVQHFIPAETYVRFHRRCFMFFVQRDTADGTLRAYIEG